MNKASFLLIPVILASVSSCGPAYDPTPRFETHAMLGSFKYLGDPIPLYATNASFTTVKMPFPIRGLAPRHESAIKVAIDDDKLSVRSTDRLGEKGEKITVHLIDGRAMPMVVYPKSLQPNQPSFQSPLPEIQAPAMRARLAPSAALVKFDDLIADAKMAHSTKAPLPGYARSQKHYGIAAINSDKLRATFQESYIGKKFTVHVLEVENLHGAPLRLSRELFKFKGLQAIAFGQETLDPKGYGTEDGHNITTAYVVVSASIQ